MHNLSSLINSGIEYRQKEPAKALKIFMNAYEISEKAGDLKLAAESIFNAAIAHLNLANYRDSLSLFEKALESGLASSDLKFRSEILRGIATNYLRTYNYKAALKYLYKAEDASIESENFENLNMVYGSFGSVYNRLKMFSKALEYAEKSLSISMKLCNPEMIQYALMSVGSCYFQLNRQSEADEILRKSLSMDASEFASANALHFLSILRYNDNDYETALAYSNKQVQISKEFNFHEFEALGMRMIGDIYMAQGRVKEAASFYKKGMVLTEKIGEKPIYFTFCTRLIKAYESTGDSGLIGPLYKKLYKEHIQHLEVESQLKIEQIDIELETGRIRREIETEKQNNRKLKQALEIVGDLNSKLEQLNEEKNDFMAAVVHDLKNPLHNMRSSLRIMNNSLKEEVLSREYTENINMQIDRMLHLIGRLLDFKAIDEGTMKIKLTRFSLADLCGSVISGLLPLAQQKEISINYTDYSNGVSINTDQIILHHILENLVSNAVKFSQRAKNIYIRSYLSNESVNIEVKDEGPGFTKKDMTKLYSKFAKLSAQPTGNENSTGLGLSIVKKLCEILGAEISLISEEGKGAVFTVSLPMNPQVRETI